jgi:hypothetical protein
VRGLWAYDRVQDKVCKTDRNPCGTGAIVAALLHQMNVYSWAEIFPDPACRARERMNYAAARIHDSESRAATTQ